MGIEWLNKYVFDEVKINDSTCSDPPAAEIICAFLHQERPMCELTHKAQQHFDKLTLTLIIQISRHAESHASQDLMLLNVNCSSTNLPTWSSGSCNTIVWSKAAALLLNPELHQSCFKNIVSETEG